MSVAERLVADYRGTGVTVGPHPMALRRADWARMGVTPAAGLAALAGGRRVRVAGAVVVRQRPGTAKGFVFLSLEDETGIANAIVRPALFERARATLVHEPFLLVDGILQHQDGVTAVQATAVRPLRAARGRALPRLPLRERDEVARGAACTAAPRALDVASVATCGRR